MTPTDCEIVIVREFDAPRTLVWEAISKPELLKRWLVGPPGWMMTVCEEDPRTGGAFRYVWRGPDGREMSMSGTYREVTPPQRISRTEAFWFGSESQGEKRSTIELAERGSRTAVRLTMLFASKEARDTAIAFGAEPNWDRLEEMLGSISGREIPTDPIKE
jgi:uncharacterized protein YndB with AHSA1/START domain